MTKLTPNGTNMSRKNKLRLPRFLFIVATFCLLFCGIVIAYPFFKVLLILVVLSIFVIYLILIIFTLGIILLDQKFRNFIHTLFSITSIDAFVKYYPQMVEYCIYAIIISILLYFLNLILIHKKRKENYSFYIVNIIMLVFSFIALIILLIFKS